jgi:hypothetical protein
VSKSTVFHIKHNKATEDNTYEYDAYAFQIDVEGVKDSSYSIRASKINITRRIFEGVSASLYLMAKQPTIVEFLNLQTKPTALDGNASLNILVEV